MYSTGVALRNPDPLIRSTGRHIRDFVHKISREFDLVMVMEYFDESLVLLRRQLCWDMQDILNFKYNSFKYDLGNTSFPKQLVKNYRRHDAIDYALYEHFNRTLWRKIKMAGSDFREELAHFRWLQKTMKTQCNRESDDFAPIYMYIGTQVSEFSSTSKYVPNHQRLVVVFIANRTAFCVRIFGSSALYMNIPRISTGRVFCRRPSQALQNCPTLCLNMAENRNRLLELSCEQNLPCIVGRF
ncbi:hypothetical protein Bbelb_263000 [Branchiostoma belcheri]|nr:hypothetical protein Bbelb_263000 [Branchiostoma belcheri]